MTCDEFEARLNAILDRRRDPRADHALAAHQAECLACREMAEAYEALLNGLSESRRLASARLPGQMPSPPRETRPWFRSPTTWWGAVAAAIALMAAAPYLREGHKSNRLAENGPLGASPAGATRIADATDKQDASATNHVASAMANTSDSSESAGSIRRLAEGSYLALARETSDSLSSALAVFPVSVRGEPRGAVGEPVDPAEPGDPAAGNRQAPSSLPSSREVVSSAAISKSKGGDSNWMERLAEGLEPLARPTAGAIDSFMRVFPREAGERHL